MSFISETIEKLKENILLASVICFFFLGGIGIGSYYLFTRSSDNTVQKENKEDKKEVVNEEITQKEEKTENEEKQEEINKTETENKDNNQEIANKKEEDLVIKPTFLLDYSKTTLVIQIVIELILVLVYSFRTDFEKNYVQNNNPDFLHIFKAPWEEHGLKVFVPFAIFLVCYLVAHIVLNFLLPLIAKFTSGNSYLSLLKNYWKKHFNNLGGCLIFVLSWIVVPFLTIYITYTIHYFKEQSKSGGAVPNTKD